jgi:hypothetical protein
VQVFPGNGDGTFGIAREPSTLQNAVDGPNVTCIDLNGDNQPDLVFATSNGFLAVALNTGNFTFGTMTTVQGPAGTGSLPIVGDVNGDGNLDVVAEVDVGGQVGVVAYLGDGHGGFPNQQQTAYQNPYRFGGGGNRDLGLADFNGDGRLDLVGLDEFGNVAVMFGQGDGTFPEQLVFPSGAVGDAGRAIVVSDFNGDGRPDVATTLGGTFDTDSVQILFDAALGVCY